MTDFIFNLTPGDIGYDIETFPNIFTFTAVHVVTNEVCYFEISDRRNDLDMLCLFIDVCRRLDCRWVGYNNLGFDYPVVHMIYKAKGAFVSYTDIYKKAMSIINAPFNARFAHQVWESDWLVTQIDLYKIHHFDNASRATSLKVLEFNMRSNSVEDLPFDVGISLNDGEKDILAKYNLHDVQETLAFYWKTLTQEKIAMRESLSKQFNVNMMNYSDVKIGEKILIHELEGKAVKCYYYDGTKKKMYQTIREYIDLNEIIFPYVTFDRTEFQVIKNYLCTQVITETKGVFKNLVATVDGLDYKIGTGGLHASVESQTIVSDDQMQLVDVDVASFYPNLGIKNQLFPAHLGVEFCDAYQAIYQTRKSYPKGSAENEAYKLALNGAYGKSSSEYSPFLDQAYTMSITINGQLLLLMLVEQMVKVPGLKMIQANTDGITYLCPRGYLEHTRQICRWWENLTQLELEEALYSRMFIRDVNSYIAEKEDGSLKRIGAYAYETAEENPGTRELPYHKHWSHRIVAKAAEAALVHGKDIREFIEGHKDPYDFMMCTKVSGSSFLEWGGAKVPNIVRYYMSAEGKPLEKIMPAAGTIGTFKRANKLTDDYYNTVLAEVGDAWDERIHTKNRSTYEIRRSGICTGWNVMMCNELDSYEFVLLSEVIDYDWYIKEAEKLVKPLV